MLTTVTAAELCRARALARRVCAENIPEHTDRHERCDDLQLVLSELVANACRHGEPPVRYDVVPDGSDLLVTVQDSDPTPPPAAAGGVASSSEGGRGLLIVEALARFWGWQHTPGGKVVWARV